MKRITLAVTLITLLSGCSIEYENKEAEAELYSTLSTDKQIRIREGRDGKHDVNSRN